MVEQVETGWGGGRREMGSGREARQAGKQAGKQAETPFPWFSLCHTHSFLLLLFLFGTYLWKRKTGCQDKDWHGLGAGGGGGDSCWRAWSPGESQRGGEKKAWYYISPREETGWQAMDTGPCVNGHTYCLTLWRSQRALQVQFFIITKSACLHLRHPQKWELLPSPHPSVTFPLV